MNDPPKESDPPQRLPWPYAAAALVAFAALYLSGPGFLGLPVMALLLAGTYATRVRLPQNLVIAWVLRVIVFAALIFAAGERRPNAASVLLEPEYVHLFGYLSAGELVLRAWLRRTGGPSRGESMVLSALVFMAATNTYETRPIAWLAPAYTVCLALALRRFEALTTEAAGADRPREAARPTHRPAFALRAAALAAALLLGLGAAAAVRRYDDPLTQWSAAFLTHDRAPAKVGVSTEPVLGPTFNPLASAGRVVRVEGHPHGGGELYLRGMTFDTYRSAGWWPTLLQRKFEPVAAADLRPDARGRRLRITRLDDEANLLYVPPDAAGLVVGEGDVERERDDRGVGAATLRTRGDVGGGTYAYEAIVAADTPAAPDGRRPAATLGPAAREWYLRVHEQRPGDRDAVSDLAARATGPAGSDRDKAAAVERYLLANHAYSLSVDPGPDDPVVNFLADKRPGHCQFFASAAVILLRCSGVPARYVNGYYAHERDADDGSIVVRQRDAHAWAEYWVDGVGWVTLDATPPSGRPDELFPPVPWWRRGWENVADAAGAARAWLGRVGWTPVAVSAGAAAAAWVAWRVWRRRGERRKKSAAEAYASPGEALAALGVRFERLLKRRGVSPVPHRTWREQLAAPAATPAPDAVDRPGLRAFIDAYDAARFGGGGAAEVSRPGEILASLERSTRAATAAKVPHP